MKVLKPEQYPLPVTGSFTRASTATYIDEGVLQTAAIDVPRWQDGQLLLEKEATNRILQSRLVGSTSWSSINVSSTVGPNGLDGNASRTLSVTGTSNPVVYQSPSLSAGEWVFSIVAKANTTSSVALRIDSPAQSGATFDLANGTATTGGSIEELNDGWYLCSITVNAAVLNAVVTLGSVVGNSIHVDFAQLESGPKPTSRIVTTTTTVTRSADVITGTGLIWTNATEATATYSSVTTYSLGQQVVYQNVIYESLQNANLNNTPSASPTWWLSLGADNITAFIDNKVSTQTTRTANLRAILATGKIAAAGLLEIDANLINFQVNDRTTYDVTYSAQAGLSGAEVFNWYDYFFVDPLSEPIKQVVFDGIPTEYSSNIVSFSLDTGATDIAALGYFVAGLTTAIGKTQYGVRAGIIDYSKKDTDEFGNTIFVERPYSKRLSADVYLDNYDLNKVQRFLYSIRATPVLWMASDDPQLTEAAYVYGFYKDFSTTISYPTVSMCNLEIEGLT